MTAELTAAEICSLLDLEPNATCGSTRVSFVSQLSIAAGGLPAPFADGQPLGSALYFLVTPGGPVRLHRIRNEQLYHYYLGDPLEVFMLHGDGSSERVVVGPDLRGGERLQLRIPGNTFHTARVIGRGRWFLGSEGMCSFASGTSGKTAQVQGHSGTYRSATAWLRRHSEVNGLSARPD